METKKKKQGQLYLCQPKQTKPKTTVRNPRTSLYSDKWGQSIQQKDTFVNSYAPNIVASNI